MVGGERDGGARRAGRLRSPTGMPPITMIFDEPIDDDCLFLSASEKALETAFFTSAETLPPKPKPDAPIEPPPPLVSVSAFSLDTRDSSLVEVTKRV